MTNRTHSLRYAGSAIAAALVIVSTPSLAQDAAVPLQPAPEPVLVLPDIPAPAAERPTIVVPPVQAETVQPLPAPSAATPESEAAPAPVTTTTRTRAAAPAAVRAAPAPAPRVAAPAPAAVEEAAVLPPATTVEPVAVEPVAPVPINEPARAVANDDSGLLALILGGLMFLALAIWGFIAIGRRKGVRRYAAETVSNAVPLAPTPVVAEPAPVAVREPVSLAARNDARLDGPSFVQREVPATAGALPHAGASVALPSRVPADYAERDALMKRMIAAKPDRANPFTDRGARTKRARLILQSLGRDFSRHEPWIDLSQYPNNWPELANKRSAAA